MAKKFFRGGAHLMHSALPKSGAHVISGVPPLTIRTSKQRTIKALSIYGNSIAGLGVGDKTTNLLPSHICRQGSIPSAEPDSELYYKRATLAYPFPITAGKTYTICATNPNNSIKVFVQSATGYSSDTEEFSGAENIKGFGRWASVPYTVTIPDTLSAPYLAVSISREGNLPITAEEATALKLYIVEGAYTESTAPEYEPCGYRIPVKVQNESSEISSVFYTEAPLYTPNDTFSTSCDALPIYPGNNIFTVNTAVAPSSVEVAYWST